MTLQVSAGGAKETPGVPDAFQSEAPQPSRHHIWKQAGNSNQAPLLGNVSNPSRDFMEAGNTGGGGGADSAGPQEHWRNPDVTRSPQPLALARLPPQRTLKLPGANDNSCLPGTHKSLCACETPSSSERLSYFFLERKMLTCLWRVIRPENPKA